MLFTNSEPSLGGPIGPALAYGKIIRSTESARRIEYRVFEDATAALADAGLPDVPFTTRIAAVHRNRELWLALTCDVADEDNALPDALRASIISIGIFVFRESNRVIRESGLLDDLIEINRMVMRGLRGES
jgi:flagellar protein FlaF